MRRGLTVSCRALTMPVELRIPLEASLLILLLSASDSLLGLPPPFFRLYPAWSRRNALTTFLDLPSSSAIREKGQQLASWATIWPFSNVVRRGFRGILWSGENFSHAPCVHNTVLSYLCYCLVKFRGKGVSSFHDVGVRIKVYL